jgi:hypothetical protein
VRLASRLGVTPGTSTSAPGAWSSDAAQVPSGSDDWLPGTFDALLSLAEDFSVACALPWMDWPGGVIVEPIRCAI